MIIYDPIYGQFALPKVAVALVDTPEFRRLSQIRLLNTSSPTLATLGEVRRYSHTLGVIYLEKCWEVTCAGRSRTELDALQAAIVLHDIGTPPFGHLFEYVLRERRGWDHESVITDLLSGRHSEENLGHQLFAHRALRVLRVLERHRIDLDLVNSVLSKLHPLSTLIFGTMDLDNLDNVVRMATFLGIGSPGKLAIQLARYLHVDDRGSLVLSEQYRDLIKEWATVRRQVYEVLVFDAPTVASQAILTAAIEHALDAGVLSEQDWTLTDEDLLRKLQSSELTKDSINLEYLGRLPSLVFAIQIDRALASVFEGGKTELVTLVQTLAAKRGVPKPLAYIFQDKGAFEKSLRFLEPTTGETWVEGALSESTVVYVFSRDQTPLSKKACSGLVRDVIGELKDSGGLTYRVKSSEGEQRFAGQQRMDF